MELVLKYGYEEEYLIAYHFISPITDLNFDEDRNLSMRNYDPNSDRNAVLETFTKKLGIPEPEINRLLDAYEKNPDMFINREIARLDDEILASSTAIVSNMNPEIAVFLPTLAIGNQEAYIGTAFARHIQKIRKREEIVRILFMLPNEVIGLEPIYRNLGIPLIKLAMYSKMV